MDEEMRRISERSREIWERQRRRGGEGLRHWLAAERELALEASSGQAARPRIDAPRTAAVASLR